MIFRVRIPCKWCDVDVAVSKMPEHIQTTHIMDKQTNCDLCMYVAPTVFRLRIHVSQHCILSPPVCTVCGKRFQTVNNLRQHHYSHRTGPRRSQRVIRPNPKYTIANKNEIARRTDAQSALTLTTPTPHISS